METNVCREQQEKKPIYNLKPYSIESKMVWQSKMIHFSVNQIIWLQCEDYKLRFGFRTTVRFRLQQIYHVNQASDKNESLYTIRHIKVNFCCWLNINCPFQSVSWGPTITRCLFHVCDLQIPRGFTQCLFDATCQEPCMSCCHTLLARSHFSAHASDMHLHSYTQWLVQCRVCLRSRGVTGGSACRV